MEQSAEVVFAQRLASNEKTIRDRALKKLKKYLTARSSESDFSSEELRKLWKGLHYSMWMQDKPLLQEELSARICSLLKTFKDGQAALNFAAAFFAIQAAEWGRLDQWRMDKYMMFTRDFLAATLQTMSARGWEESLVTSLASLVGTEVLDASRDDLPDGFRLHLADIWLREITNAGGSQMNSGLVLTLLRPFIDYITKSNREIIQRKVIHSVFESILEAPSTPDSEDDLDDEAGAPDAPPLQYDYEAISKALFEEGRKDKVKPKVRRKLYNLVQRFKAASGSKETEIETEPAQDQDENSSPSELRQNKDGSTKVKKRKKSKEKEEIEEHDMDEEEDQSEEPPAKVKKSKKRKSTDADEGEGKKKKKTKRKAESGTVTPAKQKGKLPATPQSTDKHVVFDLKRNTSRGLQEFVRAATTSPSPHLPSHTPRASILKDSPSPSPSRPSSARPPLPLNPTPARARKEAAAKVSAKKRKMIVREKNKEGKVHERKKPRKMKKVKHR